MLASLSIHIGGFNQVTFGAGEGSSLAANKFSSIDKDPDGDSEFTTIVTAANCVPISMSLNYLASDDKTPVFDYGDYYRVDYSQFLLEVQDVSVFVPPRNCTNTCPGMAHAA